MPTTIGFPSDLVETQTKNNNNRLVYWSRVISSPLSGMASIFSSATENSYGDHNSGDGSRRSWGMAHYQGWARGLTYVSRAGSYVIACTGIGRQW